MIKNLIFNNKISKKSPKYYRFTQIAIKTVLPRNLSKSFKEGGGTKSFLSTEGEFSSFYLDSGFRSPVCKNGITFIFLVGLENNWKLEVVLKGKIHNFA